MTVIEGDFGKKTRETVKPPRELLSLEALHEVNVRSNPYPYLERANERLFQLEQALFEAARMFEATDQNPPAVELIEVDKGEYERLSHCRDIVKKALAEYASGQAL